MALHQHCCTLRAAFARLAELRVHVLARNGGTAAMQGGAPSVRACGHTSAAACHPALRCPVFNIHHE